MTSRIAFQIPDLTHNCTAQMIMNMSRVIDTQIVSPEQLDVENVTMIMIENRAKIAI